MNSLDIGFGIYAISQVYKGFRLGFKRMLYDTVKWVLIFGGAGVSYSLLMPVLLKMQAYVDLAMTVNAKTIAFIRDTLWGSSDQLLAKIILSNIENARFDKIAVFIILIIVIGSIIKTLIVGSFWNRETGGRLLGAGFGFIKAAIYAVIIMMILSLVMNVINPDGFYKWQSESQILNYINLIF
ncbi:MAG: CvpA family protein [Proteocatella sp.]